MVHRSGADRELAILAAFAETRTGGLRGLLCGTLALSLADCGDQTVLAVLEEAADAQERIDLLLAAGCSATMASLYAQLDVVLLREALTDPCGALDGFLDRLNAMGSCPAPGAAA
ncbi:MULTISPECIES: hypothetical protein [Nocardioides]|uniref:Uncharacterized protein n=1 Tax=Nocardioides vastitatis TaxID=2568655 RepID=A0ABW0ZEG7_9ACTN|nr:hypothetical protein [Nocardioides sp.]THJ04340.1 hypothetical protein E7Z54_09010 [Nocardioides sp.]